MIIFLLSPEDIFFPLLLEKEEGRERSICWLPPVRARTYAPGLGMESATQAPALTRNQARKRLVTGQHSNQLSHTSWGRILELKKKKLKKQREQNKGKLFLTEECHPRREKILRSTS